MLRYSLESLPSLSAYSAVGYLGKYRKNHPTGGEQTCGFAPGKSFPTWDIDGFRLGILICFDGRHQDTLEAMKRAHVDIIHHPHGNTVGGLGREAEEWTRSKTVYFVPRAVAARAYMIINNSAEDTRQPDSLPEQQVIESTLAACADDAVAQAIEPPCLVVVGDVVRLRAGLDWLGALTGRVLDPDPLGQRQGRETG